MAPKEFQRDCIFAERSANQHFGAFDYDLNLALSRTADGRPEHLYLMSHMPVSKIPAATALRLAQAILAAVAPSSPLTESGRARIVEPDPAIAPRIHPYGVLVDPHADDGRFGEDRPQTPPTPTPTPSAFMAVDEQAGLRIGQWRGAPINDASLDDAIGIGDVKPTHLNIYRAGFAEPEPSTTTAPAAAEDRASLTDEPTPAVPTPDLPSYYRSQRPTYFQAGAAPESALPVTVRIDLTLSPADIAAGRLNELHAVMARLINPAPDGSTDGAGAGAVNA